MLIDVRKSTRKDKRLQATFSNGKTIHFGAKHGSTFIDHHNEVKRQNYIKRHRVNENWKSPFNPGSLSRYILWEKPNLQESINKFNNRFFK